MFKKLLLVFGVFAFAFAILTVSILQSSVITYSFAGITPTTSVMGANVPEVNYELPFAGTVLPDSPLWGLKAARDRVWFIITSSPLRRAELALLFSDKRLASSKILLENNKPDIAIETLVKGEKYLEIASKEEALAIGQGYDTSLFLNKLATSSLKHREIIESLMPLVPEEGKPLVVKTEDYAKNAYKAARDALNSKGMPTPIDPFDGD